MRKLYFKKIRKILKIILNPREPLTIGQLDSICFELDNYILSNRALAVSISIRKGNNSLGSHNRHCNKLKAKACKRHNAQSDKR